MPTAKVKGGPSYHRYRPASEYDDATLAQKREYWRNKKREQRARVSEHRGKLALASPGKKPSLINTRGDCAVQCFFDAPPTRNRNEVGDSSPETNESQMGKWSNSKNLNNNLSQLPASFSITTKAAGVDTVTATPPYTGTRAIYSATSSETQLLSRSSVPPVRLNMVTNGSYIKTKPYSLSMQDTSLPKSQDMAQTAYSTGSLFVSRSRGPVSVKTEVGASNPTPQCGKRSALVSTQTCPTLSKMSVTSVKRIVEPQRKLLYYGTGGIVRCKTPRQRFIDAQKNVMHQINLKFKSPMLSSKGMPKIDPAATPEQVIAKRREYWRDKKREQRAKLSMDKKVRLKEKDSLMRRVKRYQKILEDMRKARTLMHTTGEALTHSETIGGFIEEDGTLTMNVLRNSTGHTGQKVSKIQPHCKHKDTPFIRIPRPSPPLQPVQVRVSVPLAGHFTKKSQMLTSIKSQAESITAPTAHTHTGVQLRLSRPQNTLSGGSQAASNLRGCVMKMAVSSRAPSLSALTLHPELTEEERMARRREYWRIKKREQRAARAVRLKQGLIQVRAMAALEKRKAQKRVSPMEPTENAQTLPDTTKLPNVNVIKTERVCLPTTDPSTLTEQTTCSDTKPPPIPLLASPPEPDPAQSSDSQSATLLAVASMRKLLEESLSTVSEHRSEQWDIKTETPDEDEALEQDIKPDLALFVKEEVAPFSADLTLLPVDTDVSEQVDFPCPQIKNSPSTCETPPPLHHSAKVEEHPTCEQSSHSPSHVMATPSLEASDSSSPPEAQILQSFRSPGSLSPQQLTETNHSQPQQQPQTTELLCKFPEASQDNRSPTTQECDLSALSGLSSLQRKREYWKLMKRQQRARLRAQQRDRQGESSHKLPYRDIQVPGLVTIKPKPPVAPLAAISSMPSLPTLLVVRHTQDGQQSPGTVRVKPPAFITEQNPMETLQSSTGPPEPPRLSHSWTHGAAVIDAVPSLPTLKPPENPLSSINLQPIEPCHSPDNFVIPMSSHPQSNTNPVQSPTKLVPISNMVPPKPIRGESKEDFMKRKREYWRIKKKEQRARKAILHKRPFPTKNVSSSYETVLSEQHLLTQDDQWVNSSERSEHLISVPMESDPGSFSYSDYTLEGESELLLPDFANTNGEDASLSDAMWRNRFLMDYDPLNQLLVCMVCGELQYSHSLDGVRTHIDEAHPHTLTLEAEEREHMMKSWDEQVSQRERFFTSQLQQHSSAVTAAHLS